MKTKHQISANDISVDPFQSELVSILEKEYGFAEIKPFHTGAHMADYNILYTAKAKSGKSVFIKSCRGKGLSENEYRFSRQLYEINPAHFAKAIAYCGHGSFCFCATEFLPGEKLHNVLDRGLASPEEKASYIEDIYQIFLALKKSDTVHRDVHSNNLIIHKGRLILIDFQLSVSKSNYQEISYFKDAIKVATWERGQYLYRTFEWDDSNSLLVVLNEIGKHPLYAQRYEEIYNEIRINIGRQSLHYKMPSAFLTRMRLIRLYLKNIITRSSKNKKKNSLRIKALHTVLQEIRRLKERSTP